MSSFVYGCAIVDGWSFIHFFNILLCQTTAAFASRSAKNVASDKIPSSKEKNLVNFLYR